MVNKGAICILANMAASAVILNIVINLKPNSDILMVTGCKRNT